MDVVVAQLVQEARDLLTASTRRVLIGIAGIPGSGKTTLAKKVVDGINSANNGPEIAVMVPMDGYHLPRTTLDTFADPATAHFRRGAPFTFDPTSLLALLQHTVDHPQTPISAPSFAHSLKDPIENSIPIHPHHTILVFEGLYLTLDEPIWCDIAKSFHRLWFIDVPREVAKQRLIRRHLEAGIVNTEEEGRRRAEENDLVNGDLVRERRVRVDKLVPYVDDAAFAGEEVGEEVGEP